MKILITGASGFIGTNFLKYLTERKLFRVEDIVLLSSREINPYTCVLHNGYTFTKDDFFSKGVDSIDVLVHLGAFIPKSSETVNDLNATVSNIVNTLYLLQNLPSIPKKIIYISTIDVYGNAELITEKIVPNPSTLYGLSKLFCESIVNKFSVDNGIKYQVLRLGHIYGPGEDEYQKLIPLTIKKIIAGDSPVIFSDGSELRSFIYITDCCHAIYNALFFNDLVGPINIVAHGHSSIREIVDMLIKISGKDLNATILNKNIPTRNFVFDNSKMKLYLCSEEVSLYDGLSSEYKYMCKCQSNCEKNEKI